MKKSQGATEDEGPALPTPGLSMVMRCCLQSKVAAAATSEDTLLARPSLNSFRPG